MNNFIKAVCLLSFSMPFAYAATYVCPNSYQTVITGDSMQKVEAACGKPISSTTNQVKKTVAANYTQWVYTIRRGAGTPGATANIGGTGIGNNNQHQPQMLVTFDGDKVIEVSANNQRNVSNFPCYSQGRIGVGTTASQVQLQCGAPTYVNHIQQGQPEVVNETILTYNFGSYRPTVIFTFQNNKLVDIASGPVSK